MKKVLAATLLIGSLTTTTAFAKEDHHEKEFKHYKHHEVKKVKTPVQTPPVQTPTQTPTIPTTTTITNPLTGFAVLFSIPAGFDTSVKRVSVMWAKGVAYSYNVYVDNVKVKTVLDSQGITFLEFQQNMTLGIHTIGISVVDQNGNESQQCVQTVNVQ
jgi:hypothetical protein